MKDTLKLKSDRMYELYSNIKKDFKWHSEVLQHFASMTLAAKNKSYDGDVINRVKTYIKDNIGIFSSYRGDSAFLLSILLSSEHANPEEKFSRMLKQHELLKANGFKDSSYIALANYYLLCTCAQSDIDERIQKAFDIYKDMKDNHPWFTNKDDYPLAILLAGSKKSTSELTKEIEEIYNRLLEDGFKKSNGVQLLSHLLSFGEESLDAKLSRCSEIIKALKDRGYKLSPNYYSLLGLMTLVTKESMDVFNDIVDTADYIGSLKKYNFYGKDFHLMLASGIVCQGSDITSAYGISLDALLAAQTATAMAAYNACCAAVIATT